MRIPLQVAQKCKDAECGRIIKDFSLDRAKIIYVGVENCLKVHDLAMCVIQIYLMIKY